MTTYTEMKTEVMDFVSKEGFTPISARRDRSMKESHGCKSFIVKCEEAYTVRVIRYSEDEDFKTLTIDSVKQDEVYRALSNHTFTAPVYVGSNQVELAIGGMRLGYVVRANNDVYGNPMYDLQVYRQPWDSNVLQDKFHAFIFDGKKPPVGVTRRYNNEVAKIQSHSIESDLTRLVNDCFGIEEKNSLDNIDRIDVQGFESVIADCPVCQDGIFTQGQYSYECPECDGTGKTRYTVKVKHDIFAKRLTEEEIAEMKNR